MIAIIAAITCTMFWHGYDAPCTHDYPPITQHYAGYLSAYDAGVMERVVAARQAGEAYPHLPAALPQIDGYIALMHCVHVGKMARLARDEQSWLVLVADGISALEMNWLDGGEE